MAQAKAKVSADLGLSQVDERHVKMLFRVKKKKGEKEPIQLFALCLQFTDTRAEHSQACPGRRCVDGETNPRISGFKKTQGRGDLNIATEIWTGMVTAASLCAKLRQSPHENFQNILNFVYSLKKGKKKKQT